MGSSPPLAIAYGMSAPHRSSTPSGVRPLPDGLKPAVRPPYKLGRNGGSGAGERTEILQMASEKPDILMVGPPKPVIANGLAPLFNVHRLFEAQDREAFIASLADRVRGFAVTFTNMAI